MEGNPSDQLDRYLNELSLDHPRKLLCSEKAFWVQVDEERLANQNLIEDLQSRFCSMPSAKLSEASFISNSGKKSKELKVLDAKSAQNLSVVLGRQTRYWSLIFFICTLQEEL